MFNDEHMLSLLYLPNLGDFVKNDQPAEKENKQIKKPKTKTASFSQAAEADSAASGK